MATFKCSMCNASLKIVSGMKTITCEFCGTTQLVEKTYVGENNVKHGFILLSEGQFKNAREYFDKALGENAEAYEAYLGKVLVKNEIRSKEEFFSLADKDDAEELLMQIKNSLDYKNAMRFADEDDKKVYEDFKIELYKRTYDKAVVHMEKEDYERAIELLKIALEYEYTPELLDKCEELMIQKNCEEKYVKALEYMEKKAYKNAIGIFKGLKDYKESEQLLKECKYRSGEDNMKAQEYMEAISVFEEITDYMDSKELLNICENIVLERRYQYAKELLDNSDNANSVKNAKEVFLELLEYKDSVSLAKVCDKEMIYIKGKSDFGKAVFHMNFKESKLEFEKIADYKDSKQFISKCKFRYWIALLWELGIVIGIGAVLIALGIN